MKTYPERIIINKHETVGNRGHLKIFFSYASGAGKTYAMLEQAKELKKEGKDVVIGYIEPHGRSEIKKLLTGFEKIEYKDVNYNI